MTATLAEPDEIHALAWNHPTRGRIYEITCTSHRREIMAALRVLLIGCTGQAAPFGKCTRCENGRIREWMPGAQVIDQVKHLRDALDDRDGQIMAMKADAEVLLDEKHAARDGMRAVARDLAAARAEISGLKNELRTREADHLTALGVAHQMGHHDGVAQVEGKLDELHRALAEAKVELERLERELRARGLFHVVQSPNSA